MINKHSRLQGGTGWKPIPPTQGYPKESDTVHDPVMTPLTASPCTPHTPGSFRSLPERERRAGVARAVDQVAQDADNLTVGGDAHGQPLSLRDVGRGEVHRDRTGLAEDDVGRRGVPSWRNRNHLTGNVCNANATRIGQVQRNRTILSNNGVRRIGETKDKRLGLDSPWPASRPVGAIASDCCDRPVPFDLIGR